MKLPAGAPPVHAAESDAALGRDAWLFRHVPDSHPLRELMLRHRGSAERGAPRFDTHAEPSRAGIATERIPVPEFGSIAALDGSEIARRVHELPALPRTLTEALRVVRRDDLSADCCVQAIEQDAMLAARVLRLANSSFYGARGRVASISDAVRLLGLRTVAGVVVMVSMRSALSTWRGDDGLFETFWLHATATATVARELAPFAGADPDEAFLAGLLHDFGHAVLAMLLPDLARLAQASARADDVDPLKTEAELMGRTHDDVGAAVARHWQFPENIVSAVALHHAPPGGAEPSVIAPLAPIVHVADAIAHALDVAGDPMEAVPPVDHDAWRLVCPADDVLLEVFERVAAGVALLASDR